MWTTGLGLLTVRSIWLKFDGPFSLRKVQILPAVSPICSTNILFTSRGQDDLRSVHSDMQQFTEFFHGRHPLLVILIPSSFHFGHCLFHYFKKGILRSP